jgi:hypothetical protein
MDPMGALLKRPVRYGNIDGTGELGLGVMGMGFFALLWLQGHSLPDSIWHSMWALFFCVGLMSLGLYFGTKAIKDRMTYPRTGFVAYRGDRAVWAVAFAFLTAAMMAAAVALASRTQTGRVTLPFVIASFAFVALYAYRVALAAHWKWIVAGGMTVAAIAIAYLPNTTLAPIAGFAMPARLAAIAGAFLLLCLLWSAMWLISGGISLSLYRHRTAQPDLEKE